MCLVLCACRDTVQLKVGTWPQYTVAGRIGFWENSLGTFTPGLEEERVQIKMWTLKFCLNDFQMNTEIQCHMICTYYVLSLSLPVSINRRTGSGLMEQNLTILYGQRINQHKTQITTAFLWIILVREVISPSQSITCSSACCWRIWRDFKKLIDFINGFHFIHYVCCVPPR